MLDKVAAGGIFTVIGTTGVGISEYTDTTVTSGNTYYYKNRALSAVSNSDYTSEISVSVP